MKSINTITIINALYHVRMLIFFSLSLSRVVVAHMCLLYTVAIYHDKQYYTNQSRLHQLVTQTSEPMLEPSQPEVALPAAATTIHTTIAAESGNLTLFWPQDQEVWFTKVQVQFMTRSVRSQKT